MVKDRRKLRVNAGFDDLGRVFAVDLCHLAVDEVAQITRGVFDFRRIQILRQKLYIVDHIRNCTRIFNYDLARRLITEIIELLEHLVGRAEEYRAAAVGVGEFLRRLEYLAVLLVLGIEKMHVACGDNGLTQLTADLEYAAVIVLQNGDIADNAVIDKKAVIAQGLNFKIIVKRRYAPELGIARSVHDRAVQLAHSAGRTYKQSLAVLNEQTFRHGRGLVEIFKIRLRYELVQVFKACLILYEQYHMPRFRVICWLYAGVDLLNVIYGLCPLLREHGEESSHYARDDERVVRGAVVIEFRQAQSV